MTRARRDAISLHDRSILVEAGAGSGKTAVMAGRIAIMLAEGIAPKSIAAVTFTELAASELLIARPRIRQRPLGRTYPAELRSRPARRPVARRRATHLAAASAAIDEITCSTIHGFCQRLIKPYPVEANIDPGASCHGSQSGRSRLSSRSSRLAAGAPLRRRGRHHRRNGASQSQ